MEINKDIEIVDYALLIKKEIFVIADLHLGQEESIRKHGVVFPLKQFRQIKDKLEKLIKKSSPKKIIITGDFKHEFHTVSNTEWSQISEIIDLLNKNSKLIIIKGNHDTILKPITKRKNIQVKSHYTLNNIYICHGDALPKNKEFERAKTIIIGHEHPAITLKKGGRREKYRCFLKGKYKGKTLIVMPAFNPLSLGSDILKEKFISPFLNKNLDRFEIIIMEDKPYYFGKLKDIKNL